MAMAGHAGFNVPGCLFANLEIIISFGGFEYRVTVTKKLVAGNSENGFDKFPNVGFISSDVLPYLRNIGNEAEVKIN